MAVAYLVSGDVARQWSGTFYTLALVSNYPHYMATIYRAYGRGDRAAHHVWTWYGTAMLVLLGLLAHVDLRLLPWVFTAYIMWSPWHYTGQNFGLMMMFLRRGGLDISARERRYLRTAFVASYVMLIATFNEGASADPLVFSLALPAFVARGLGGSAALVFVVAGVSMLVSLSRRAPGSALLAPSVLYLTQALWFVAPATFAWVTDAAAPQTRYSSGILAVMHAMQYLWITQYFARREQGASWAPARYWLAVVAGGTALFLPIPWLASYVGHVDFTASMLIVASVVNLHHFMLDGVVWKLRDPRVANALTAPAAPVASVAQSVPATRGRRVVVAAVIAALVSLAAIDQWRYRLVSRGSSAEALQTAVRLNPFDSAAQMRLLRVLVDNGRQDEARTHLDRMIAARPGDIDALVNAGVLARQTNRPNDAVSYWQRALDQDSDLFHVHLYLAELLDAQGRSADAIPHYRAYLELVIEQKAHVPPDPSVVISVIVKFGQALAGTGQLDQARTEFDLAIRMARQTGLLDLETIARRQRDSTR